MTLVPVFVTWSGQEKLRQPWLHCRDAKLWLPLSSLEKCRITNTKMLPEQLSSQGLGKGCCSPAPDSPLKWYKASLMSSRHTCMHKHHWLPGHKSSARVNCKLAGIENSNTIQPSHTIISRYLLVRSPRPFRFAYYKHINAKYIQILSYYIWYDYIYIYMSCCRNLY